MSQGHTLFDKTSACGILFIKRPLADNILDDHFVMFNYTTDMGGYICL